MCPFLLLSYDKLSRKPHLFKSFTGLSVKQFDNIYQKIEKYANHETNYLLIHNKDRIYSSGRNKENMDIDGWLKQPFHP
jgi:phosphodiesterase/alkaline phosphatase D-like protein